MNAATKIPVNTAYVDLEDRVRRLDLKLMILVRFADRVANLSYRADGGDRQMLVSERDFSALHLGICDAAEDAERLIVAFDTAMGSAGDE